MSMTEGGQAHKNKSREWVRKSLCVLVSKSVGPEEFQPRVIAPGSYLSPSHNLA